MATRSHKTSSKAGAEWRNWTFNIGDVIETPDAVVVEGRYSAVYEPTGRELDAQACHVWRFRNGRIASFHQYVDTARVQHVDWTQKDGRCCSARRSFPRACPYHPMPGE